MPEFFDAAERPEKIQLTGRAQRLAALRAVYEGTQYDGRADWWTGQKRGSSGERVPLRERKPCVIYRLPKASVDQVVRFLFGEGRFPQITVKASAGVDTDTEAETLQSWISEFIEHAAIKPKMRALARRAITQGTACAIMEVIDGEFSVTLPHAEHCAPRFRGDNPANEVTELVWCYEYEAEVVGADGNPSKRKFLFRRDYTETEIRTYAPVAVRLGVDIDWGEPEITQHGLGFCPVIWIRNEGDSTSDIDGVSLIDGLQEEFAALDFTMSQRFRGIAYLGAPQPWETGVDAHDGPGAAGRTGAPGMAGTPGYQEHGAVATAPARRMSPDEIWSYEGERVTLGLLETSGKSFEVASLHIEDIRGRCLETMGVVLTSLTETVSRVTTGKEMSAKFLALAHAPLLNLVNEYRHNWWPYALKRIVDMAMRILATVPDAFMIENSDAARAVVISRTEARGPKWFAPQTSPVWGSFFEPSTTETKESVSAARDARDAGLLSRELAMRHVADDFGISDVAEELDRVEREKAEAVKVAQDAMRQEAEVFHAAARGGLDDPSGNRSAGRARQGADASGRASGPVAPQGVGT